MKKKTNAYLQAALSFQALLFHLSFHGLLFHPKKSILKMRKQLK